MEGGERAADPDGPRGLITADRLGLGDDVLVERPPRSLAESGDGADLPVAFVPGHGLILRAAVVGVSVGYRAGSRRGR